MLTLTFKVIDMTKRASLNEVAKLAGVSIMTVSRVINNPQQVSEKTRRKVEDAIKQLKYYPNALAQSLVRKKTNILGLVMYLEEEVHPSFYHEIMNGVQSGASALGYDLLIFSQYRNYDERIIRSRLVDGVVFMGVHLNAEDIRRVHDVKFPYILIGKREINDIKPYFIAPDYIEGLKKATNYLIQLGHSRIAFIGASKKHEPDYDKLVGYQQALYTNQILYNPELVFEHSTTQRDGYNAMKKLLQQKPTAVIVNNTNSTIGAITAIRDEGLRIPDDISIIGFDDNQELNKQFSHLIDLKVTRLKIPKLQLGERATKLAISLIDGNEIEKEHFMALDFLVGDSCRSIR
jgi:DNA-binding LacI/PurR family transcriptional regulator